LKSMDDEETESEIDRALAITLKRGGEGPDHMCCGRVGVAEILSTAGRLMNRPELCDRGKSLAWETVARSKGRGGYALGLPSVGILECRGLFQGMAGIGFTLLRFAAPNVLPEPLLLR
jgi:lantibiotic modifying enzyme